jgi:hypothetical protein
VVIASNDDIKAEMERCGLTSEDIAAHSTRKGGRSYCAGGSTNGPAYVSIQLRGGWSLEGIDKRYVRYERCGDQYCGRILSGLNVNIAEFAYLPPFFVILNDSVVSAVRDCFPGAPVQLEVILRFALASVVYHQEYLHEFVQSNHPVFKSCLFTTGLAGDLKANVNCRPSCAGDTIVTTGIPSYVIIMGKLKDVESALAVLPLRIKDEIQSVFDSRNHGMWTHLTTCLKFFILVYSIVFARCWCANLICD